LSVKEVIPPISLGWESLQEQVIPSNSLVQETRKVDNEYSMDEFKTVLNKLVVEDKYVKDYPMDSLSKSESDKRVIDDHHLNVMGGNPVNSLNSGTVIEDIGDGIPFKYKRLRKVPTTRTDGFLF
jgi:hypothetical protein